MIKQPNSVYHVGLDLGPLAEFSALAVIERPFVPANSERWQRRPCHSLRHLHRFPPGTPYPDIVEVVRELFNKPPLPGAGLIIDETGVGKPLVSWFVDQLRGRITAQCMSILISAGHEVALTESGLLSIPKKNLASGLQVLLQTHRLQVASSLPDSATLVKELQNFKVKVTTLQENTLENWRDGQHDDLVLAVALAVYFSEYGLPDLEGDVYEPIPTPIILAPWWAQSGGWR